MAIRASPCARTSPPARSRPPLSSGGAGGEVGELSVGRSGLGDGLVAFRQGALGNAAVVGVDVTAPPRQFAVSTPHGWVKPSHLHVSWEPEQPAGNPALPARARRESAADARRVVQHGNPDGAASPPVITSVQVLAIDANGQAVLTPAATLLIDGVPPTVKLSRSHGGHVLTVRVLDAYSGVAVRSVRVSFGDGHSAKGKARFTHRYARAGIYHVTISASDKLGIGGVTREPVSVP